MHVTLAADSGRCLCLLHRQKSAVAEPAAKKKSSSSSMGGWDWGLKSTPKKTAAKPSGKKVAAAAAESKAKQEEEAKVGYEAEVFDYRPDEALARHAEATESCDLARKLFAEMVVAPCFVLGASPI